MTFKLNKKQITERDEIIKNLQSQRSVIEGQLAEVNDQIEELNRYIKVYNQILGDAAAFIETITDEMGDDYTELKDEWEGVPLDEEEPIELIEMELDHVDDIEGLRLEGEKDEI